MAFFLSKHDDHWYLCTKSDSATLVHKGHLPSFPEHVPTKIGLLSSETVDLANDYTGVGVNSSQTSVLLSNRTNSSIQPTQVRYLNKRTRQSLQNTSSNSTSAERVVSLLDSYSDISYSLLVHQETGSAGGQYISYANKGRPRTNFSPGQGN